MKRIHLILSLGIFVCGSLTAMSGQQHPIRVGGNVQESRLIHRIEPIYPEEALAAQIQGAVILVVTQNERGMVTDIHIHSGHPLLKQSAVDAVRQWRYSPTYLNGVAVPVEFTVVVNYRIAAQLVVDGLGTLTDPKSGFAGDALTEQLRKRKGAVVIYASANVPFDLLEENLRNLQKQGIPFVITNSPYVFHDGRLFHAIPGLATEPELVLDREHLIDIACASGRLPTSIDLDSDGITRLAYKLFISETGKLLSVQRIQGPEIQEIETELARTPVITPATIGADPVPAVATVEIPIGYDRIKSKWKN